MFVRHRCLLYEDALLFFNMFQHVSLSKMFKIFQETCFDLLAKFSMLLATWLAAMMTINKKPKNSASNRKYSYCLDISPKIKIISNNPIKQQAGSYKITMDVENHNLVLLYTWLSADEYYTHKYVNLYLNLGFDVLKVCTSIQDAMQPETGSQVSAHHVVTFLNHNKQYSSLIVYAMSIGGYAFGESLVQVEDNQQLYGDIPDRYIGQIFDSGVDYNFIAEGLSKTLAKNEFIQKCIESCFDWFLKINYEHSTRHYERSSNLVRLDYLKVPTLFIGSKIDYLSMPDIVAKFKSTIATTRYKCFDDSPHLQHYRFYPEEYEKEVVSFIEYIKIFKKKHTAIVC